MPKRPSTRQCRLGRMRAAQVLALLYGPAVPLSDQQQAEIQHQLSVVGQIQAALPLSTDAPSPGCSTASASSSVPGGTD